MCEIEESSRKILNELVDEAPDILTIYEQGDFLKFVNPIEYDLVIMNPPFHLQKANFTYLDKDYYDIDFVKRSYYMLKDKGELIALVRTENTQKEEFKIWLKNHDCIIHNFDHKNWEASKEKGLTSEIKNINLSILVLYRNINNKFDTQLEHNRTINPDLTDYNEVVANHAQLFHTTIIEEKHKTMQKAIKILKDFTDDNTADYIEDLEALKADKANVSYYDVRKFLNKWKKDEYNENRSYLFDFARNNGLEKYISRRV